MGRAVHKVGFFLTALTGVALGALAGAGGAAAQSNDSAVFRSVTVPKLPHSTGDVLDPLPADAAYPSDDPRNFEGLWASISMATSADGNRPAIKPAIQAEMTRVRALDDKGTPVVRKGTLCRADGIVGLMGNQFPTMVIQRPDKIIFIAEEGRMIWHIWMNAQHPADFKPNHLGHSVGHWEGNTLVVDTVGLMARAPGNGPGNSAALHVVNRFTRANTGDKRNGDVVVTERTVEDPGVYEKPYRSISISRWRPDLEMLEFNCEESTAASQAEGVTVE